MKTKARAAEAKGSGKAVKEKAQPRKKRASAAAIEPQAKRCCDAEIPNPCCEEFRTRIIDIRAGMRDLRKDVDEQQELIRFMVSNNSAFLEQMKSLTSSKVEQQIAMLQQQSVTQHAIVLQLATAQLQLSAQMDRQLSKPFQATLTI